MNILRNKFRFYSEFFNDYIIKPKKSGFRSLNSIVDLIVDNKVITTEIQIKTKDMHSFNEYGPASHTLYKIKNFFREDTPKDFNSDTLLKLHSWGNSNYTLNLFTEYIFVFTKNLDLKKLKKEVTVLDFAYAVHSKLGSQFAGAKVNNISVKAGTKLKNVDIVEILVNKNAKPNVDWLRIVRTSKARRSIKKVLRSKISRQNKN